MGRFHRGVYAGLRPLLAVYCRLKFGYRWKKAEGLPERYIVLANHTTDFDPLFVALSFPRQMYFVASEHVARWGWISKLLTTLLDPIWRPKGSVAAVTAKEILRRVRDGSNVCLFAEGNRSWDGCTGPILPSTGKLVQKARCGLVTYKLTGGYFVSPRWSDRPRKGPVSGAPVRVYTPEELAAMSLEEINAAIHRDLYEDAYRTQRTDPQPYRGRDLAAGLENLLFLCPTCGQADGISTRGDQVHCSHCGAVMTYDAYGMLQNAPFDTVRDLTAWQLERVAQDAREGRVYTDRQGALVRVEHNAAIPVDLGPISLSPEALTCGRTAIPVAEITSLDIYGKRGIVFTAGRDYYELRPGGNAWKFVQLYRCLLEIREK